LTGPSAQLFLCVALALAASGEDLWRRRISNRTVAAALAAALPLQIWLLGWRTGTLQWAGGAGAGFAVFLVFFLLGGMGGGDIKLMAAFGACVGLSRLLEAALLASMAGALVAVGYLVWRWAGRRGRQGVDQTEPSIPYAPAISAGALLSLVAV